MDASQKHLIGRMRWIRVRVKLMRLCIEWRVHRGYEKKSSFDYACPNPHAFINHCICDFAFTPPIKILTTKEWKILDLQMRGGRISPQKREEFYSYEKSVYTVNSIGAILGGLGMLAESFLTPALASTYMDRIACLADERSHMTLRGAKTTDGYIAKVIKLLLDAKRDFPR